MSALETTSTEPLYSSPIGLYDFQADDIARSYYMGEALVAWDTGLGKTHLAMALGALLTEDSLVDRILIVCEKGKLDEWVADLEKFTRLETALYHGDVAKRERIREDPPRVFVSTYETIRNDAASFHKNRRKKPDPGPLIEALRGENILVVYDEATKLKTRTSLNHRAHRLLIDELREAGAVWLAMMTATPAEKNLEDVYNLLRILRPELAPTVAEFEKHYVAKRDDFGEVAYFKNETRDDLYERRVRAGEVDFPPFDELIAPVLLRKRKTDPDVVDQFPEQVEEFTYVDLSKKHLEFIDAVEEAFSGEEFTVFEERALFNVVRQLAADPRALLFSEGKIASEVVARVGTDGLEQFGSPKTDRLLEDLDLIVNTQEAQAVIYTFFGQSVLRLISEALEDKGFEHATYHGGLSDSDRRESVGWFRSGEVPILLTSDAAKRGVNLTEASYILQYELPLTYADYSQRMNRNHRIDSTKTLVTNRTLIVRDTIEEVIERIVLRRNASSDLVLGDVGAAGYITATDRRRMLKKARQKEAS